MPAPTVFISYSHKDKKFMQELHDQLKVLQLEDRLDVWVDTRIETGTEWYPQIQTAMQQAAVGVMLISKDFLISNFIRTEEIPKLLERREEEGMRLFPIIIGSCPWERVGWLNKLQVLQADRPVAPLPKPKREAIWADIARKIDDALKAHKPTEQHHQEEYTPASGEKIEEADRQKHIKNLIYNKQRRLDKLREKQARQGHNTPAEILIEIEDLKKEIDDLHAELASSTNQQQPTRPIESPAPPSPPSTDILPPPRPSWQTKYLVPSPALRSGFLGGKLKGYSPFPRDNANYECGFLFHSEVSGFWSYHPLYDSGITQPDCPDIIVGEPGTGKTAFARALVEIGDSSGIPLRQTLPLYLPGYQTTFKTIQDEISSALLKFVNENPAHFNRLDVDDREFVVAFLAGTLTYRRVRWRRLLPEASKSPETLPTDEKTWLGHLRDITDMEPLGLRQVVLAIDLSDDDIAAAGFCINRLKIWQNHRLMVKLFMPDSLAEQVSMPAEVNRHTLTWTDDQLQEMAGWRFGALARFAQTQPRRFDWLFKAGAGVYRRFIEAAHGNPRRLAGLWHQLEATVPPDREYVTEADLEKAIRLLDG